METVPSSPYEFLGVALLVISFLAGSVWLIARNLISDAPFPLDLLACDMTQRKRSLKLQVVYALRWFLFASIWLAIISGVMVFVNAIYENQPGAYTALNSKASDYYYLLLTAIGLGTWLVVLIRRVSLRWPLTGLWLCLIPVGGLITNIIGAIGFGRFMVASVGRQNFFAPSRLRPGKPKARPRGLVEEYDE